jgi:hypothetical protein
VSYPDVVTGNAARLKVSCTAQRTDFEGVDASEAVEVIEGKMLRRATFDEKRRLIRTVNAGAEVLKRARPRNAKSLQLELTCVEQTI